MIFELHNITSKLITENTIFDIYNDHIIDTYNNNIIDLLFKSTKSVGSTWYSNWTPYEFINNNDENYNDENYNDENYNDENYNDGNYNDGNYNDGNYNDDEYTSSITNYNNNNLNLNFIGFAILVYENNNFNVIFDQVSQINDFSYIEDGRLFIDSNNNIKCLLNSTFNEDIKKNISFINKNNKRGIITIDLGKINNILININIYNKILIAEKMILFPEFHKYIVEKNWVHFKSDKNEDWICNFNFPFGTPFENIHINEENDIFLTYKINYSDNFHSIKVNFFEEINKYYLNSFRFSGGSCLVDFNLHENLGIGHLVIDMKKMKKICNEKFIDNLINSFNLTIHQKIIIYNNIRNIISRPKNSVYIYDKHSESKLYLMYFYTQSKHYPFDILRISNAFTPNIIEYNTGIVFPCGLCINQDNIFVSYGESDNICSIFKTTINNVNNILLNINTLNPSEYILLSYDIFNGNKIENRFIK